MHMLLVALRSLRREWRSGELAVLLASLSVAVGALTGVGFLTERIGKAVEAQASEVLAADARVESPEALSPALAARARELGLATARLTRTLSVVFNGDVSQLANVRAASDGYPLRGTLQVAAQPFGAGAVTHALPAPGECWPDSRLAAALGARVGDTLNVGAQALRISAILASRPDQGAAFVDLASSLLINDADLATTRLIQPASRVRYGLLLAGTPERLEQFRAWFDPQARPGERYANIDDASPQIGDASRRAGRFLALASLVAALLCAVAVAISARGYVARHLDVVALMKTLGAERRFVLGVTLLQLLLLALVAAVLGALAGWVAQNWLLRALAGLLRADLPPAGWLPALLGLLVALAMLAGFALPSLLQLTRVPALRVLRRDAGPPPLALWLSLLPAVLAVAGVVYGTLGDWRLSAWFIAAIAGAILVLGLAGAALVQLAGRARGSARLALRHGLANLSRRRTGSVALVIAFGLGMMLVLLLAILRRDLVDDWRASLPANAPNYFFVNIPDDQRTEFAAALKADGAQLERLLPMVRGRLLALNDVPIAQALPGKAAQGGAQGGAGAEGDERGNRSNRSNRGAAAGGGAGGGRFGGEGLAEREQNLTWSDELGDDNRIVGGQWWTAADAGQPLVSVATEFQEALGLKLGDRLRFDVAGETLEVKVASFRKVKWDSFRPNFFIMFPPGLLDGTAGSWMTSARYEPRSAGAMASLVRRFPSVSVFNVGDLLAQVRAVIDKSVTAVQSVFFFTLLAGVTVLLAAVQSSRDERTLETAILRVLGASRAMLRASVLAEFAALGAVAGLLAASGAALGGWLLARQLGLNYHFNAVLWAAGFAATVLLVAASGWLATRPVLNHSPREALH
jgi:putative ABC transport system permease protein